MDKKTYTPQEVAINVLKKAQELYKNSNLAKSESGNSAHIIEAAAEPKMDNAECPECMKLRMAKEKKEGEKKVGGEAAKPTEEVKETPAEETKEETDDEKNKKKISAVAKSEDDIWTTLEKALFKEYKNVPCEAKTENRTKEGVARSLKWKIEELKNLKDLKWNIESEYEKEPEFFNKIKEIFEKRYSAIKKEIAEEVAEYSTLKKSEIVENDLQKKEENKVEEIKTDLKKKAETAPSKKPPKAWFDKKYAEVKAGNPKYTEEQINSTVGSIWYKNMSTPQKKEKREAEGKTYGKAPVEKKESPLKGFLANKAKKEGK